MKLTKHTLSTWAKSPGMPKRTITGKQWLCSSIQACSWILMKNRKNIIDTLASRNQFIFRILTSDFDNINSSLIVNSTGLEKQSFLMFYANWSKIFPPLPVLIPLVNCQLVRRDLSKSCWSRPLKRYCKFSLVVNCYNFVKKGKYTKCLGASSTTSAGWSVPMLAKQAPLQLIYFCILSTKKDSRKTSYIKNIKQNETCITSDSKLCSLPVTISQGKMKPGHHFYVSIALTEKKMKNSLFTIE